ncbi:MAG TPA: winged helix family transcriptional regulator [Aurantimonas coralicida]|uniref:Winged helix family transcriptional regulator n=2 Tax=root TaxID=1 RepID=A0A9C9NI87_9HYPH|nr:winged helix family transcriptional regulator [Aurantimonas coralicida]HEU01810.1 winged helix family transcriptional regulator [Aurantimonas coralicida]
MTGPDRLLAVLRSARGAWVRTGDLVDAIYGDRADGGPVTADTIVRVWAYTLRRRLPDGIMGSRQGRGYRLRR